MVAFTEFDWGRFDMTAIVSFGGLATIDEPRYQTCRDWLVRQGYEIDTFDCRPGLTAAISALHQLLRWEEKFGYTPPPGRCNMDALRDGFQFTIQEGGGRVLEIIRPDVVWEEDRDWLCGLLAFAQEHCREQLALGRRFFTLLVVPENSPLIGSELEAERVPGIYWSSQRSVEPNAEQLPRQE